MTRRQLFFLSFLSFFSFFLSQERIHITDQLLQDFSNRDYPKIHKIKRKKAVSDTNNFYIRNILKKIEWKEVAFFKIAKGAHSTIWLEKDLKKSDKEIIKKLASKLSDFIEVNTPSNSLNPKKGMLELTKELYGDAPNVDGDNKLDILLLDIKDNYQKGKPFLAGYFDPIDQTAAYRSNRRDIIYIDISPGIIYKNKIRPLEFILSVLAHEYQHLVHFNYEGVRELPFLNEGLSELSSIFHGLGGRDVTRYFSAVNQDFLSWKKSSSILIDYERTYLFHYFLYEKYGYRLFKKLCQDPKIGYESYRSILRSKGDTFETVIENFHLTNLLNRKSSTYKYKKGATKLSTMDIITISHLPFFRYSAVLPGGIRIFDVNNKSLTNLEHFEDNLKEIYIEGGKKSTKEVADYIVYYNANLMKSFPHRFNLSGIDINFSHQIRLDDGIPDTYSGKKFVINNAGINNGFQINLRSPDFTIKLNSIHIFALFESDLKEQTDLTKFQYMEIIDSTNCVIYSDTLQWKRKIERSVSGFEDFEINKSISMKRNTNFSIRLTNIDTNVLNIALDFRKGKDSQSYLLDRNGKLKSFSNLNIDATSMKNYNIMLYLSGIVQKKITYHRANSVEFKKDSLRFSFSKKYDFLNVTYTNAVSSIFYQTKNLIYIPLQKNIKNKYFVEAVFASINSDIYQYNIAQYENSLCDDDYNPFHIKSIYQKGKDSFVIYSQVNESHYLTIQTKKSVRYSVECETDFLYLDAGKWRLSHSDIFHGTQSFRIVPETRVTEFSKSTPNFSVSAVFPNPTRDYSIIDIQASTETLYSINIYSVIGQLVFSKKRRKLLEINKKVTINWKNLGVASGIFYIRIQLMNKNLEEVHIRKVVYLK